MCVCVWLRVYSGLVPVSISFATTEAYRKALMIPRDMRYEDYDKLQGNRVMVSCQL